MIAVDAVNAPKEFMVCKQLVAERKQVDPGRLADLEVDMKEFL